MEAGRSACVLVALTFAACGRLHYDPLSRSSPAPEPDAQPSGLDSGSVAVPDGGGEEPSLDARTEGGLGDAGGPSSVVVEHTLAAGNQHTCGIGSGGAVYCWGSNASGQLGDGTEVDRPMPTPVTDLAGTVGLTAGRDHTCAVLDGGDVRCWGTGDQLGHGSSDASSVPVVVSGLTDAVEIDSHWAHTCARRAGGAVQCWGANNGRLGNGETTSSTVPVDMLGVSEAVDVAAGWGHSCVARMTGTARCTGTYNAWGQNGDGTTENRVSVVDVSSLTDAVQITTGSYHTCALTTSGRVHCWGNNQGGQVGNGTISQDPNPIPVEVSGLTDVVQVVGGGFHTCVLRGDGTVYCWGGGGRIGNGTTDDAPQPDQVSNIASAVEIVAGNDHTCARLASGELWCWGDNTSGQLGDGTTDEALTPVRVLGAPLP